MNSLREISAQSAGSMHGKRLLGSPAIRRIAVLRAGGLSDMLCAVPALQALRAAAPAAHISLIASPWAAVIARRFHETVDDFIAFPGFPGLRDSVPDLAALPRFIERVQQRHFDLLLQMHDGGTVSNPLAVSLGAMHTAGFFIPGEFCPEPGLFLRWTNDEHETLRCARLVSILGADEISGGPEFPLVEDDRMALQRCDADIPATATYACIAPGRRSSGCWPAASFAALGDRLAQAGLRIVLTGTATEAARTAAVKKAMRMPALDIAGQTDLGALAALVADARMLICASSGPAHIAAAVATPSIAICTDTDAPRKAPLNRKRHRLATPSKSVDAVWDEMMRLLADEYCEGLHGANDTREIAWDADLLLPRR